MSPLRLTHRLGSVKQSRHGGWQREAEEQKLAKHCGGRVRPGGGWLGACHGSVSAGATPPAPPPHSSSHVVLPRWHSLLQRDRQLSFQAGTWCTAVHTVLWQASVQASTELVPQTVTHVLGVASCRARRAGGAALSLCGLRKPAANTPQPLCQPQSSASRCGSKPYPPWPGCPSAA